jgi:hypothetical protein
MRTPGSAVRRQPRLLVSISALACMAGATDAAAAYTEFESFHLAVVSRDEQAALAFIDAFPASPLIDDLIVMLPRAVAQEVCADLPGGGIPAQDACRKSDIPPGPRAFADSGAGDAAISPAAGPGGGRQELGEARPRSAGATGERSVGAMARLLLPSAPDSPAAAADGSRTIETARQEADAAPTAHRAAAPPAPRLGGDPGSDPGAASSPSSLGGDPGSDPGSGTGGGGARDSHN